MGATWTPTDFAAEKPRFAITRKCGGCVLMEPTMHREPRSENARWSAQEIVSLALVQLTLILFFLLSRTAGS